MHSIAYHQTESTLLFSNGEIELRFCARTGRWRSLHDTRDGAALLAGGGRQASALLTIGGRTTATRGRRHWDSLIDTERVGIRVTLFDTHLDRRSDEHGERATLTLCTREGDWEIDRHITLYADLARIERNLTIRYTGTGEALLRDVTLRLPPEAMSAGNADVTVEVPGYPTRTGHAASALPIGEDWDRTIGAPFDVGWEPGVVGIAARDVPRSLIAWCHDEVEPVMLRVRRTDDGVQARHVVLLADRFTNGRVLEWGAQYVEAHRAPWRCALGAYHEWLRAGGIVAPESPDWARDIRIYEVFVGEQQLAPDVLRRSRYRSLEDIVDDLPRIRDLGFSTVELMPAMPFPSYAVVDYYDVDAQYGSAAGLAALVKRAHQLGLRVLLDVIVHGVMDRELAREGASSHHAVWAASPRTPDRHPLRDKHPEWFVRTDTGAPAATYTWAFDHANEGWRAYITAVFEHYLREYAVDGFRVDALTWNLFPNWAPDLPYRASAAMFGSRELSERLRPALQAIRPDVVLYTETTIAAFLRAYDLIYDYDIQWIYSALVHPTSPRGFAYTFAHTSERIVGADLGPWLAERRLVLPQGTRTIHHVDSHDSHEWGRLGQYRREAFGEEAVCAFLALCCFLEGGVMVFTGAEDRSEGLYRRLLHLKTDLPALSRGTESFDGIEADDPHVFAFIRRSSEQLLVPVVSFSPNACRVRVSIDGREVPLARFRACDHVTGLEVNLDSSDEQGGWALTLDLEPFQAALVELQLAESFP